MGQFSLSQESFNSIPEADVAAEDSAVSSPVGSLDPSRQHSSIMCTHTL